MICRVVFFYTITIYSFRFKIKIVITTLLFSMVTLLTLRKLVLIFVSIFWNNVLLCYHIYSIRIIINMN